MKVIQYWPKSPNHTSVIFDKVYSNPKTGTYLEVIPRWKLPTEDSK